MKECARILVILFTGLVIQCSAMSISELEDFSNYLKKTSQLDETLKKGTDPNDFDEDEAVSDHAWEESGKFEGDLILNERQRRTIVEDIAEGLSRNGLRDSTKRWPDNEVIYYIQKEHFTSDQVQAIQNGIDDLAQASCVKFRPYRKGDRDAVVIQGSRRGCFSQVGYQGGYQVLNLSGRHPVGRGCFRHGTVVHELLHTLGFYHMQSSPDRDDYVEIVWENIVQPARHNFRKYNAFSVSDFGVGYDYDSVLHYSKGAFSSNGQDTIVPKQGGAQIGQRVGLSDKDTQKLNKMYCDADNNNDEADTIPIKSPNKKKKPKNKPFEGHGIGYHQGKTVVIKLSPSAETYHIMNKPAFPMFNHFSKTPQVLSTKEIEGPGRRIADTHTPYTYTGDYHNQARKELQDVNGLKTIGIYSDRYPGEVVTKVEKEVPAKEENNNTDSSDKDDDGELSDAFRRLAKILRTHVYPTNLPDLKAYMVNTDYSEFEDPKRVPKIISDFVPTSSKEEKDDRGSFESEYIQSLYKDGPESLNKNLQEKTFNSKKFEKIDYEVPVLYKEKQQDTKTNEEGNESIRNDPGPDSLFKDLHDKVTEPLQRPKEMYEIVLSPNDHQVSKEAEAAYRTAFPFKVHQIVSNGSIQLETPEYARYEHLKNKNDYSRLYFPYTEDEDEENAKRQYKTFGHSVPTYDKWFQKDYLKRNPVDYDRPSFTYVSPSIKSDIGVYDTSESTEHNPSHQSGYTGSFSPQTKQAYSLYGDPVPLTQNWFKVNSEKLTEYPYSHYHDIKDNSESKEDAS